MNTRRTLITANKAPAHDPVRGEVRHGAVKTLRKLGFIVPLVLLAAPGLAQTTVEKPPDLGPGWNPLNPNGGTYVYANCFIAPAGVEFQPQTLGTWLLDQAPGGLPPPTVRFEIWGNASGRQPDPANILATTGSIAPAPVDLEFIEAPVLPGAQALNAGERYWFAATVVGEAGDGSYQVGQHTQNSAYLDNCTFWYSNDPAGNNFDGRRLEPEMAFSVTLDESIPIQCQDIQDFRTGCPMNADGDAVLLAQVTFNDPSLEDGAVEVRVNDRPRILSVRGGHAILWHRGARPGEHTLELAVPAGCFSAQVVTCP